MKGKGTKWAIEGLLFLGVAGALYTAWTIWDTHIGVEFREAFEDISVDGKNVGFGTRAP